MCGEGRENSVPEVRKTIDCWSHGELRWFENKSIIDGKNWMASCKTLNIGWERLAFGFELLHLLKSVQCFGGFSVVYMEIVIGMKWTGTLVLGREMGTRESVWCINVPSWMAASGLSPKFAMVLAPDVTWSLVCGWFCWLLWWWCLWLLSMFAILSNSVPYCVLCNVHSWSLVPCVQKSLWTCAKCSHNSFPQETATSSVVIFMLGV